MTPLAAVNQELEFYIKRIFFQNAEDCFFYPPSSVDSVSAYSVRVI